MSIYFLKKSPDKVLHLTAILLVHRSYQVSLVVEAAEKGLKRLLAIETNDTASERGIARYKKYDYLQGKFTPVCWDKIIAWVNFRNFSALPLAIVFLWYYPRSVIGTFQYPPRFIKINKS